MGVSPTLPRTLGGVTVLINSTQAYLFFVSPGQINFLVPASMSPAGVKVTVLREGTAGAAVPITLSATAPGLFQLTSARSWRRTWTVL